MSDAVPEGLPGIPRDEGGPVFAEPWQAQAFALTLQLHERGCFSWSEWAACLARRIDAARRAGDPDLGDTYYLHWLGALEDIVLARGLGDGAELLRRKRQWDVAARNTPHGRPIELKNAEHD